MATCTKCGKINYDGVKYCTACGTPLSVSSYTNSDETEDQKSPEPINENQNKSFSEKSEKPQGSGIDPKIIYIILGVVVIIGLIFFFKSFLFTKGESKVDFLVEPDKHVFTDQPVTFKDRTKDATSWEWDFGDNSEEVGIDPVVTHTFEQEGTYMVKLTVNGKYTKSVQIFVTHQALESDKLEDIQVKISGPQNVKLGETVTYTDNTVGATEWTWMMMETGEIDSREKSIIYKFQTPGWKTIRVKNSKARNFGTLKVKVAAAASKPPSGEPKKKENTPENKDNIKNLLKSALQKLIDDKKDELAYIKFADKFLCSDISINVIYNGKPFRFGRFSNDITNIHPNQKILSVDDYTRDPSTKCITQLVVTTSRNK